MAANRKVTEFDIRIATLIRKKRIQLGISQISLGKALGVSYSQFQKYEAGINKLSPSSLFNLMDLLKIEFSELQEIFKSSENPEATEIRDKFSSSDFELVNNIANLNSDQKKALAATVKAMKGTP